MILLFSPRFQRTLVNIPMTYEYHQPHHKITSMTNYLLPDLHLRSIKYKKKKKKERIM